MSSLMDESYRELCESFAERARCAKLCCNLNEFEYEENDDNFNSFVPNNLQYTWTVGLRSDSELMWCLEDESLYVSNGKILKSSEEAFTCNYPKCQARVYLQQDGIAYKVKEHTIAHGSMYDKYMEMQCRQLMREECKSAGASKSVTDIYNDAVIKWNNDSKCSGPFPVKQSTVEKTLKNLQKAKYETSPNSIKEIQNAFDNPVTLKDLGTSLHREKGLLFNYAHEENDFSYCVLSSAKSIELIIKNLEASERFYLIDGTFRITPMSSTFKQVLIIHAQFGIKSYPLVSVLMSNRTTEAYKSVFDYIHQNVLPLDAGAIITDFERALRNALNATVPLTKLLGCWFHHCQALRGKVASIGELFELIKHNKEAKILYRKLQCLALLPAPKIRNAFDVLGFEALDKFPQFEKFLRYYDNQWIKREGPESYSVFLQDTRTTGAAEAFNGKCGKSFKTHGNFFNFCSVFQREEVVKCNELERDVSGLIQKDTRKKKFKDRALVIEHFSRLLENKKISVNRFLCMMSNMDNKIAFEDFEFPILHVDDIEFETETDRERFVRKDQCIDVNRELIKNKRKRTRKVAKNQENPVLTRSKARKAAVKQQEQSHDSVASSSQAILEPSILTRSKKRRAQEIELEGVEKDIQLEQPSAKRVSRVDLESSNSDLEAVIELMSSSAELKRLQMKFIEILNGNVDEKALQEAKKSIHCIMACNRRKSTVLLPCKHQPTCNQCHVLWKLFVTKKQKKMICPLCKELVSSNIVVSDD